MLTALSIQFLIVQLESYLDPVVQLESYLDPVVQLESYLDPVVQLESYLDPVVQLESYLDPVVQLESYLDPVVQLESYLDPVRKRGHRIFVTITNRHTQLENSRHMTSVIYHFMFTDFLENMGPLQDLSNVVVGHARHRSDQRPFCHLKSSPDVGIYWTYVD